MRYPAGVLATGMPIIDAHVHLYPAEVNAAPAAWAEKTGEAHWAKLCARTRKNGQPVQGFPSVDELLRDMDAAGVERAVLQGWYWEKPATCVWQNEFYAECIRKHPDRLAAFATLHPAMGEQETLELVRRAAHDGFIGLGELSPHSQGFSVDDPIWQEVLMLAGELQLPINLHVTEPVGKNYPGKIPTPLGDFVRMAQRHPQTDFILAHWGARLPFDVEWGDAARSLANIHYDTAASPWIYDGRVFSEMVSAVGAQKILFGSDYPLTLYPGQTANGLAHFISTTKTCGLPDVELKALLGDSARNLLGL